MRANISIVNSNQNERITNNLTVYEIIISAMFGSFGLNSNNQVTKTIKLKAKNIIKNFSLQDKENKKYRELSDGEKRIVLIARSLINDPKVLILDEPTINLDLRAYYHLLKALKIIAKKGISLLIVTNKIEAVIKETTRVIFIKNGNIIEDDIPEKNLTSEKLSYLFDTKLKCKNFNGYWRVIPSS